MVTVFCSDFQNVPYRHITNEFVEKIIVHERVKGGRYKKSQRVDIHLNFIGMVELPSAMADITTEPPPVKRYVADNMSFVPLSEFLEKQDAETITLSFEEIERIIGKPLCKSARKYKSYWYPAYDRPLSNVIYNAGFDVVRVDLEFEFICLNMNTKESKIA